MADINRKWPWPANSAQLGTYPEEVKALRKLEQNPDASPVPETAPTRLLTPQKSSEGMRMGQPMSPTDLVAQVTLLQHIVLRRVLRRSRSRGPLRFDEAIEDGPLEDVTEDRREQMRSMLARERAMLDLLERYNAMAETVYAKLLSESQG